MKECIGMYQYKGFLIVFSDYQEDWRIEPNFFYEGADDIRAINFACEFRDEHESFKTIAKAKKYIRENEEKLKQEVLEGYRNY